MAKSGKTSSSQNSVKKTGLSKTGKSAAKAAETFCCEGAGDGATATLEFAAAVAASKPTVDRFEATTHQSSRGGTDIDHIVLHYTTSSNIEGSISWFKTGNPRTSAHYIVGRDGELVQMVNDSHQAWHAGNGGMNRRSIGIEHVAAPGQRITAAQAAKSSALIAWLRREYDVSRDHVIAHRCVPRNTSCCGDLFAAFGGFGGADCDVHGRAIKDWMTSMGI